MRSHPLELLALLLLCSLSACQTSTTPEATPPHVERKPAAKGMDLPTRNNALALLDELLNDEKHVSKLLIIKRESPELNRLIKSISETAGRGADRLKALAKKNPGHYLAATALPPGETATRESIAKVKQHLLLHSSGGEFEFQLLLTQAQALNYGSHLAKVAAANEPQPAVARELSALSARLNDLLEQVLAMMRPHGKA